MAGASGPVRERIRFDQNASRAWTASQGVVVESGGNQLKKQQNEHRKSLETVRLASCEGGRKYAAARDAERAERQELHSLECGLLSAQPAGGRLGARSAGAVPPGPFQVQVEIQRAHREIIQGRKDRQSELPGAGCYHPVSTPKRNQAWRTHQPTLGFAERDAWLKQVQLREPPPTPPMPPARILWSKSNRSSSQGGASVRSEDSIAWTDMEIPRHPVSAPIRETRAKAVKINGVTLTQARRFLVPRSKKAATEDSYSSTGDRNSSQDVEAESRDAAEQQYQQSIRRQVAEGRLPKKQVAGKR